MVSLSLKAFAYGAMVLGSTIVAAFPAETLRLERRIAPDNVAMYTPDYFVKLSHRQPPSGTCLFYTAGMTEAAVNFSKCNIVEYFTIWDIWDPVFYNRSQEATNPLRDILKFQEFNNPDTQSYFRHMSEAFAEICKGDALVMSKTPDNIDEKGIWGQVEKPTLQKTGNIGGQCDRIDSCDVNGSIPPNSPYWVRPGSFAASLVSTSPTLVGDVKISAPSPVPAVTEELDSPIAALPSSFWTGAQLAEMFSDIDSLW